MPLQLTEEKISALLAESKHLPERYWEKFQPKPKRGHDERELDLVGSNGSEFRLIFRKATLNVLDFSDIFAYRIPNSNTIFRLRRYNGKSHEHTNQIEKQTFYGFHIHMATERYQIQGMREDSYAELTGRYGDFNGALACMIEDCAFVVPPSGQTALF